MEYVSYSLVYMILSENVCDSGVHFRIGDDIISEDKNFGNLAFGYDFIQFLV